MGRKILKCNIGDVFGCYKVISEPVIEGEHSFVDVECLNCGSKSHLCLSEIKNRVKKNCSKCRVWTKIKFNVHNNDIFNNWKVIDDTVIHINKFRKVKCKCLICGHEQYIRIISLCNKIIVTCEGCKVKIGIRKQEYRNKLTQRMQNQPYLTKFNRVCHEAAIRSIPVFIKWTDLQDIYEKQGGKCALTGENLIDIKHSSVDRIDRNLPYQLDNIQLVTPQVNVSKHILNNIEFIQLCQKVVNHANQQPSTPLTKCEGSETN